LAIVSKIDIQRTLEAPKEKRFEHILFFFKLKNQFDLAFVFSRKENIYKIGNYLEMDIL
jgi:hypothetical protein